MKPQIHVSMPLNFYIKLKREERKTKKLEKDSNI